MSPKRVSTQVYQWHCVVCFSSVVLTPSTHTQQQSRWPYIPPKHVTSLVKDKLANFKVNIKMDFYFTKILVENTLMISFKWICIQGRLKLGPYVHGMGCSDRNEIRGRSGVVRLNYMFLWGQMQPFQSYVLLYFN